ncbi:ATP-binding protein [Candidatus Micrarchaeota archaeon]|nr:ATP-binding protein [Candidatus Micrarchaeota archaeon]
MREVIKTIIKEFHDDGLPKDVVQRDFDRHLICLKLAKIIVGPRRAGKTYLLFQIMRELMSKGYEIEDFIYINFEDNRLIDFTYRNFEDILEGYREMYPSKKPILFLDEIHNVDKWEFFVRRLVDKKYSVYLTGSNAHLFSKEYATKLGGRYVEIKLYPASFKEFLRFKGMKVKKGWIYSKDRFKIIKFFDEFLKYGGFPEVINLDKKSKEIVLKQYLDTVLYRDVISRYNVEDSKLLEFLIKKLAENVTNPFSFSSIVRKLKAIHYKTNVKTLSKYYSYLTDSFLIINTPLLRDSLLKREMERKTYFVDNGYLHQFYIKENKDKLLENMIAVHLLRERGRIYYLRNGYEIDFVDSSYPPIQVTYELNEDNREREVRPLLRYMEKHGIKKGYIITYNQEETIKDGNKKIQVLPAYKFLLK